MENDLIQLKNSKGEVFVTIRFDLALNATVDTWCGEFESKENFRKGLLQVLKNIKKNKSERWLADLSKIEGSFSHSQQWISLTILPVAKSYGLKYEAIVLPNDIFSMLSVQESMEFIDYEVLIRLFGTKDKAIAWLNSKQ